MKRNDILDLHTKNLTELVSLLSSTRGEIAKMRLDQKVGKLKNLRSIFMKRKDVARILTEMKGKK